MQYLIAVHSLAELKVEKAVLEEVFNFFSIEDARRSYRSIVLTRMAKEDKALQINLKLFYLSEVELKNEAFLVTVQPYCSLHSLSSMNRYWLLSF